MHADNAERLWCRKDLTPPLPISCKDNSIAQTYNFCAIESPLSSQVYKVYRLQVFTCLLTYVNFLAKYPKATCLVIAICNHLRNLDIN